MMLPENIIFIFCLPLLFMSNLPAHIKELEHIRALLNHPAVDHLDIERRVNKVFRQIGYGRRPFTFNFEGLYRAASKDQATWFNDPSGRPLPERLYCPPSRLAPLGRCNKAGQSVFYCSTENGVPVFEVRAKLNQTVVISIWVNRMNASGEMEIPISINGLVVGVEKIVSTLPDGAWLKNFLLENDDIYKSSTPSAVREVDAYIGELFTESTENVKNLYWFTSAIANVLLYKLRDPEGGSTLDGLIYPSVESKFSGQNIVLKEEFAATHLKILGAPMYKVMEYDADQSRYSLRILGGLGNDKSDGSPIWKKTHPKYGDARYTLSPETQTLPYDSKAILAYEDEE
ncbi:hypothetical protein [Spirosoma sp. 48-14]|uniref:hypothetical protein n=1 Tax=Spirosoma sp. 48-14 TaxID=1895854 RepID=UPI000960A011|nr:hypothetical protein [Spirosoma sp. 48-14]OJW72955.1 MAG: hypothetical protein BGO59_09460 [Spirosoma sp. 48-14]